MAKQATDTTAMSVLFLVDETDIHRQRWNISTWNIYNSDEYLNPKQQTNAIEDQLNLLRWPNCRKLACHTGEMDSVPDRRGRSPNVSRR